MVDANRVVDIPYERGPMNLPPREPRERDPEIERLEWLALDRLRRQFRAKPSGAGKWECLCPVHENYGARHGKSMTCWRDKDGKLRFKCWKGCDFNDIRTVLGLPVHRGGVAQRPAPRPVYQPATKSTRYNFPALAGKFAAGAPTLAPLAKALGVSVASLTDADVGRCYQSPMYSHGADAGRGGDIPVSAWTFPMVDPSLNVIGLRLRALKANRKGDVDKFSWTDSTPGLFVGKRWTGAGPILIVEGPTDRATGYDWGYDTIGRPSCNDAGEMVFEFLRLIRGLARRDVVILSQLDLAYPRDKKDPSKGVFYPGQDGARELAELIFPSVRGTLKVITPPPFVRGEKIDARRWKNEGGGTRAQVDRLLNDRNPYTLFKRSA